jgi:hypothetical protein
MKEQQIISKVQENLLATKRRCEVNGVTKQSDIDTMAVSVNYADLKALLAMAGRSQGMIWNQEMWV